jgi:hypothetical protein
MENDDSRQVNSEVIEAAIASLIESRLAEGITVPVSVVTKAIRERYPEIAATLDIEACVLRYVRRRFEPPNTAEDHRKHAEELRRYLDQRRKAREETNGE